LPTRFGVQFKLFWFYYTQRRAGRPRSSPRRYAAIVGCADVLDVLVLPMRVPPHYGEGKTRPYNVSVFWFWAIEIPVRVGDPVVGLRRRYSPRKPCSRLPTLRLPTRFGVPFKLVWFYYTQRRAGRPRSSPSPLSRRTYVVQQGIPPAFQSARRFAAVVGLTLTDLCCRCIFIFLILLIHFFLCDPARR
jgi:hypothetical protein